MQRKSSWVRFGCHLPRSRDPEWAHAVERHLDLWQQIVDQHKANRKESLSITPEFGPPDYMHEAPCINRTVGDVWEQNAYMKELLVKSLKA